MAHKLKGNPSHKWFFDLPWHMVELRDWFYMVNAGFLGGQVFLHVRVLGIRSRWVYEALPDRAAELLRAPDARNMGESCPADRHVYFGMFLSYPCCPYCGERITPINVP